MSSSVKSRKDIETIREGGKIISAILRDVAALAKPGVSTLEMDSFAEDKIRKAGGRPAFKNYGGKRNPFPGSICASVNSVVVHGVPSRTTVLKEGDIIGIDIGMEYKGMYTDTAITAPVGRVSADAKLLIKSAKAALEAAIGVAGAGMRIGDISWAIQSTAEAAGFNVVRDLVGHGVGYSLHEEPQVPCYGKPNTGVILREGMVLAIEPMLTSGDCRLELWDDGWTIATADRSLSAHFEHTIAVTKGRAEILT